MSELESILFPVIHPTPASARFVEPPDPKPMRTLRKTNLAAFREAMVGMGWMTTSDIAKRLGIPNQEAYNRLRGDKIRRGMEQRVSIRKVGKVIEWRLKPSELIDGLAHCPLSRHN